MQCEMYNPR